MVPCSTSAPANAERAPSTWEETRASSAGPNITAKKRKGEPKRMARFDTLCYIIDDKKLLMLKKSVGLFGGGKWNGLGGKISVGESPKQACIREVYEESGLNVENLKYHGALKFWFGNTTNEPIIVYVFSTKSFEGQLKESPEGILKWIDFDKVPYEDMWEDDQYWLPMLMKKENFDGEFHFNQEGTKLLNYKLRSSSHEE